MLFKKKKKGKSKVSEEATIVAEQTTVEVTEEPEVTIEVELEEAVEVEEPTITAQLKAVEDKIDNILEKLDLQEMTVEQLKEYAKDKGVKLNRGMTKAEIVKKIAKRAR